MSGAARRREPLKLVTRLYEDPRRLHLPSQVIQVAGALAILAAFVAAQLRVFDVRARTYLWLNFAGALVLGIVAWHERQYGFLLLEIVWTLVSAWGLATRARGARA